MAIEIERRFLLTRAQFERAAASPGAVPGKRLRQAYLSVSGPSTIRVRITTAADGARSASFAVKSAGSALVRQEFEVPVPVADAEQIIDGLRVGRVIEKCRIAVPVGGFSFELDRFEADLDGLFVAEIELPEEAAEFPNPDWLGPEITGDPRYSNASLALAETLPPLPGPGSRG